MEITKENNILAWQQFGGHRLVNYGVEMFFEALFFSSPCALLGLGERSRNKIVSGIVRCTRGWLSSGIVRRRSETEDPEVSSFCRQRKRRQKQPQLIHAEGSRRDWGWREILHKRRICGKLLATNTPEKRFTNATRRNNEASSLLTFRVTFREI
ncbi:hypothetical protein CEXT_135411 [Caerostris extrusa]|uniref:Uncharacterized protein n=1 Tax=Caerostris extrusa TaxID=172846 RepID=A0AAV4UEF3_CAEEX|nr:hypothetical protein CEXT_135411 [Caerostris extrusa]